MTTEDLPTTPSDDGRDESGPMEADGESTWPRFMDAARTRFETVRSATEARRDKSQLVDVGFLVLERNRLLPATVLIGALASRIVIFVVPLFVLVVFGIGVYSDVASTSASDAAREAGMAGLFAQAAEDSTGATDGLRIVTVVVTFLATLWAANGLGRLMRRVHALVWRVPLTKPARAWALPLAVLGLALVGLVLSSLGSWSRDWAGSLVVSEAVVEFVGVSVLWLWVSRSLPHAPSARRWSDFVPGALLAATGIVTMRLAIVIYLAPRSVELDERYGSAALALVLLTWAYWLGFIMAGSADLNSAVHRHRMGRGASENSV